MQKVSAIVCCDQNFLIGDGIKMPWHIPEDLKFFKKLTTDHVICMGRNTWDGLPKKPLPNRVNIVISRNKTYEVIEHPDVDFVCSPEAALMYANSYFPTKKIFIIGGATIYNEFYKRNCIDEFIVTHLKKAYPAENPIYFPQEILSGKEFSTIVDNEKLSILKYEMKIK